MHTINEVKANIEKMKNSDVHIKENMEMMQPIDTYRKVGGVKMTKETTIHKKFVDERTWSDLPVETVMLIATSLTPVAYARMLSIFKSWWSIVPPTWLPLTPCLVDQHLLR